MGLIESYRWDIAALAIYIAVLVINGALWKRFYHDHVFRIAVVDSFTFSTYIYLFSAVYRKYVFYGEQVKGAASPLFLFQIFALFVACVMFLRREGYIVTAALRGMFKKPEEDVKDDGSGKP